MTVFRQDRTDLPLRTREIQPRKVPVAALNITATTSGAAQTWHTAESTGRTEITKAFVRNTTGSTATLTFHAIPSGDAISDANEWLPSYSVPANTTLPLHGLIGTSVAASTAFKVFSGTNGALLIWGEVEVS